MTEITQKTGFSFWVMATLFGAAFALIGWQVSEFNTIRNEHRSDLERMNAKYHQEFVTKEVHELSLNHIGEKLDLVLVEVRKK